MSFLKNLKSKASEGRASNTLGKDASVDDQMRESVTDKKNEIFKKLTVGLARTVLNSAFDEENKQQMEKEKSIKELEKTQKNARYLLGSKRYENGAMKSLVVSIEPLNIEQISKVQEKRLINEVFSQVETISKNNGFLKRISGSLPNDGPKMPQQQLSNAPQPFQQSSPSLNFVSDLTQKSSTARDFPKSNNLYAQQESFQDPKAFFQLTSSASQWPKRKDEFGLSNYVQLQKSQTTYLPSQNQLSAMVNTLQQQNQLTTGGALPTQPSTQKKNQNPFKDEYSFSDDFSIEMPAYSRYRTFFFKPMDRENMFEGMKYIQYEQYVRKDNIMQGVMTLDLTKILSDKCYSLKTALSDKFKIKKIFSSLRPQQKIDMNKKLEETIALQESIALFIMQDFRDSLDEVGIDPSPLDVQKQNRMNHLNIIFRNMSRDYYIEHVFNQIYEEEFQRKFSEQPLQEQYDILVGIKKLLTILCEKIAVKIEDYQMQQQENNIDQFKLEDDSEIRDYLKQLEATIHNTKAIPSTHTALSKRKEEKNSNEKNSNQQANANNKQQSQQQTQQQQQLQSQQLNRQKTNKLFGDESFETNKQQNLFYEVFKTKNEKKSEQTNNDSNKKLVSQITLNPLQHQQTALLQQSQSQAMMNTNYQYPNNNNSQIMPMMMMPNLQQQQQQQFQQLQGQMQLQQQLSINPPLISQQQQLPSSDGSQPKRRIRNKLEGGNQSGFTTPPEPSLPNQHLPQIGQNQNPSQQIPGGFPIQQLNQNLQALMMQQQQQQQIQHQTSSVTLNTNNNNNINNVNNNNNNNTNNINSNNNNSNQKKQVLNPRGSIDNKGENDHRPYMKMVIKDIGDEYQVFDDNVYLYEKIADFLRDCIDSYRVMVRQKEFQKFDDVAIKKFLRYSTKVRFNISELQEQFRNFEKSVEQKMYWKSVMSNTGMSSVNFQSASKYAFKDKANSTMTTPRIVNPNGTEQINTESRKQRIGRLQIALADKFNFTKRQTQTRESKVELNNYKFEQEKQLLMDSHLSPDQMINVVADNRRKLALQRLRNPFEEPFKKVVKKKILTEEAGVGGGEQSTKANKNAKGQKNTQANSPEQKLQPDSWEEMIKKEKIFQRK